MLLFRYLHGHGDTRGRGGDPLDSLVSFSRQPMSLQLLFDILKIFLLTTVAFWAGMQHQKTNHVREECGEEPTWPVV